MTTLGDWIAAVCADLGIDQALIDERLILDLVRDVAHQVDRPSAPVTAFLLGYAVASGQDLAPAAARLTDLAATWASAHAQGDPPA